MSKIKRNKIIKRICDLLSEIANTGGLTKRELFVYPSSDRRDKIHHIESTNV